MYRGNFLNHSILHPGIINSFWLRKLWSIFLSWLVGKVPVKEGGGGIIIVNGVHEKKFGLEA